MFAVRVQNLVRGPLNSLPKGKSGGPTFRGVGQALGHIVRGGPKKKKGEEAPPEPDVIKDMSFEIEKGSITVIPGGDSRAIDALTRMMTGSLQPTSGRIEVNGSIAGLLRVGENLDDDSTARESIEREGRYLRVPEEREAAFREEVLEFAGLKDFEDVQVRRYSTGMSLRLGLALILCARPSVVVMGDIMGVGDLDFRERTTNRLRELAFEGMTFLLTGPAFGTDGLADRRIYIERGRLASDEILAGVSEDEDEEPASHDWHVAEFDARTAITSVEAIDVRPPAANRARTEIRVRLRTRIPSVRIRLIVDMLRDNHLLLRSVSPTMFEVEEPRWVNATVAIPPILASIPYRVRITCEVETNGRVRTMRIGHALDATPRKPPAADLDARPQFQPELQWTIDPIKPDDLP